VDVVTDTRLRIIEAARTRLLADGYAGLSTRKVAHEAGVPLSQVHYHFGSKGGMVLALLAAENERRLARQTAMYAEDAPLWRRYERACDFLEDDLESGYVRILWELWAAGLAHVSAGNVDFGLVGNILIGSIPGVWLGSHWSVRVNPAVLRTTLAIVLIGAGLALLIKAGLDLPLEILIPFPVAVIVLLVVTMVRGRRASKRRDIQIPSGM